MSHFHISFTSCSLLKLDDTILLIISPSPSLVISTRYRLERGESYIVVSTLESCRRSRKLPSWLDCIHQIPFSDLICSFLLKLTKKASSNRCRAAAATDEIGITATSTFRLAFAMPKTLGFNVEPEPTNGAAPQESVMDKTAKLNISCFSF